MCTVSNIGDQWKDQFPHKWPKFDPDIYRPAEVSRIEFEALRQEMLELKKLLKAAAEFDAKTGQPHCESDSKVALIKAVAKLVGVDLGNVFDQPAKTPKKGKEAKK